MEKNETFINMCDNLNGGVSNIHISVNLESKLVISSCVRDTILGEMIRAW